MSSRAEPAVRPLLRSRRIASILRSSFVRLSIAVLLIATGSMTPASLLAVETTPTSTRLSGPASANAGELISLEVAVVPVPPAASVSITDGDAPLASVRLSDVGTASFALSALAPGEHHLRARFDGTADHAGSQSDVLLVAIGPRAAPDPDATPPRNPELQATTMTLAADHDQALVGDPITLTAVVSPAPDGGRVAFRRGGATVGVAPVDTRSGRASLQVRMDDVGARSYFASFAAFGAFGASTSDPISVVAVQIPTSVTLTQERDTSRPDEYVTFEATVSPAPAYGDVFLSSSERYGRWPAAVDPATGRASWRIRVPAGDHQLVATVEDPQRRLAPGVSSPIQHRSRAIATSTTLTLDRTEVLPGAPVSVRIDVSPAPSSGLLYLDLYHVEEYRDHKLPFVVDRATGSASYLLAPFQLDPGTYRVRGRFYGSLAYAASLSEPVTLVVAPVPDATSVPDE